MMHNSVALQRYHQRLRSAEAAVNPLWVRRLDRLMYLVGALGLLMTTPQVYEIWVKHNAGGVSAISWVSYFIFSIIWLIYGVAHREKIIIFTQFFWVLLNALIAIGAIIY